MGDNKPPVAPPVEKPKKVEKEPCAAHALVPLSVQGMLFNRVKWQECPVNVAMRLVTTDFWCPACGEVTKVPSETIENLR